MAVVLKAVGRGLGTTVVLCQYIQLGSVVAEVLPMGLRS